MNGHTPEQIASAYATLDLAMAHPLSLNMSEWARVPEDFPATVGINDLTREECGTAACFAGWHAARLGYRVDCDGDAVVGEEHAHVADLTRRDLGLTDEASDVLFLKTAEEELPWAIECEFGRRPAAARNGDLAPEHQARRGDEVEAFIKRHRDAYRGPDDPDGRTVSWAVLDNVLDAYRLHADTGTALSVPESEIGPYGA